MDMGQYLEIFIEESKEHLQNLNEALLELENQPNNKELVNEIFRAAHTLKGMAATMGFNQMQTLTHDMENVLAEIRNGKIEVSSNLLDVLFQCLDVLENYVDQIVNKGSEGENIHEKLAGILQNILKGGSLSAGEQKEVEAKADSQVHIQAQSKENGGSQEAKHLNITFNEYESRTIQSAKEDDFHIYGITVYLQKTCMLKAARAFVIFNTSEKFGEIIKSYPKVQDIEDEKFEYDFSLYILSKESKDKIWEELCKISEVDTILIDEMDDNVPISEDNNENKQEKEDKGINTQKKDQDSSADQGNAKPKASKTVRVDIERLDTLMNLVSELIIIKNGLENIEDSNLQHQNFNEQVEYLERITTNLHDAVMKVRMVPVERVFNRFPRMIRDLSRKLGKDISLHMTGKETELDRTVIDEIGEPLVHLLRNAADHGLETPEDRAKNNKSKEGNIYLRAFQDGNNVVIQVQDDGWGIDVSKIKKKAINNGVVPADVLKNMNDQDIIELLFKPSFSTAEKITDVSGRGVGLDVVKTKIEALGGNIEIKTQLGKGSTFTIRLPLTLAIIQALMVKLGQEKYAIPLNTIQTIEDIELNDIKQIQGKEVIVLRDHVIPLIHLDDILDLEKKDGQAEHITVVIVKKGEKIAGLVVDSLIGQQEIVIKSLGKYLSHIKIIAGATILGDGEVALILDTNVLV